MMSMANSNKKNPSSLESNAKAMASYYSYALNGYFGQKGKNYRIISSNDSINTSIDFYKKIGKGGTTTDLPNGKGTKTILNDGTVIVHRIITSTKGSPAVEITVSGTPKIKKSILLLRRNKICSEKYLAKKNLLYFNPL